MLPLGPPHTLRLFTPTTRNNGGTRYALYGDDGDNGDDDVQSSSRCVPEKAKRNFVGGLLPVLSPFALVFFYFEIRLRAMNSEIT